jgi:hypothetical protein
MKIFNRRKYTLDVAAAGATLQNVFETCNQAPNTIPFDKLVLKQDADTGKYDIWLVFTFIIFILTAIIPVLSRFL